MAKLLQRVGEYFLGTETIKFYRDERGWYREFVTDSKDLKKLLIHSKIEEGLDLVIGKLVPNLIDVGTIASYFITDNPPYGLLVIGEGLRLACIANSNKRTKKLNRMLTQSSLVLVDGLKDVSKSIGDLADKLHNEGEEWKNPPSF